MEVEPLIAPASVSRDTSFPSLFSAMVSAREDKTCQVTSDRAVSIGAVFTYIQLHGHKQMKLDELVCNSAKQNGSPSQPPICFPLMKTFGTVLCPVHSLRASWSSAPSPKVKKIHSVRVCLPPNPMVIINIFFSTKVLPCFYRKLWTYGDHQHAV